MGKAIRRLTFCRFTVAGFYLPTIVGLKNASLNLSLQFTYASYFAIYTPGIVGVLLGVFCYDLPGFGRKWTMVSVAREDRCSPTLNIE